MQILSAVRHGDAGKAQQLNEGLKPLWDLFIEYSSLRVVYAAVNQLGICRAAPPARSCRFPRRRNSRSVGPLPHSP